MFGLKSIGISTNFIESVVVHELDLVLDKLDDKSSIYGVIQQVKLEELEHKNSGENLAGKSFWLSSFISKFSRFSAYAAKSLASVL